MSSKREVEEQFKRIERDTAEPSETDKWLRTATRVRDDLIEIKGQVGGFCGEAAYVLAYLINGTVVQGSYQFKGEPSKFDNPHLWVEKEGYIIDPTAEQYGDFEGPIVTKVGDKHYIDTVYTFRTDPQEVRRIIEEGHYATERDLTSITLSLIRKLLKASDINEQ